MQTVVPETTDSKDAYCQPVAIRAHRNLWYPSVRQSKAKSPPLEAAPATRGPQLLFRTGEVIKESGIYRVHHGSHRLPHEVTVLQGQRFPRCAKCDDAVMFELIQAAEPYVPENKETLRIYLYELPVLDEDADVA